MGPIEPLAAALCLELAGERIIFMEEAGLLCCYVIGAKENTCGTQMIPKGDFQYPAVTGVNAYWPFSSVFLDNEV